MSHKDHDKFHKEASENRKTRGKERNTYGESITVDEYRDYMFWEARLHYTSISQGFSFMTCYSREELSFLVFLRPFEFEVWITLLSTIEIIVVVFVLILMVRHHWDGLEAIWFAQFVAISIMFEKPTDMKRNIQMMIEFRLLFGFYLLLIATLTNGYLGLSIIPLSAPLKSKSVTQFHQLAKPACFCNVGDMKCHIERSKGFMQYDDLVFDHILTMGTIISLYDRLGSEYPNTDEMLVAVQNKSIRGFDANEDFILMPYSIEGT
ncbi:hypothetical protein Fcan01_23036 [Folsomia candida]|uniref:Uncharacterized protein n=1 Tax=Folsomia candida TaxID=158441 RepID=A0A226DA47_FOLCA|nr:hypothetical protein Fcan01_23036 [Folsomia candida]